MQPRAFCLAALVSTTLAPTSAYAQVGGEFTVFGGRSPASPLRWSVGAEATLLVGSHFTLGPRVFFAWGDFTRRTGGIAREEDNNATVFGGDVGVRFLPGGVEIRPVVYLGAANLKQVITVGPVGGPGVETETTATEPLIAPGVMIMLPLRRFRIGGEMRYVVGPDPDGFSTDFDPQTFVFYVRLTYAIGG